MEDELNFFDLVVVGKCKYDCASPIIWGKRGEKKDAHGTCEGRAKYDQERKS